MTPYREQDDDDAGEDTVYIGDLGDDSDEEPTVPCPHCRREILEDLPQCPYCDRSISAEDYAGRKRPLWVIATALVLLGIAVWSAFKAF